MAFHKKKNIQLTRKQKRKQTRKEKKVKRNEFYSKKRCIEPISQEKHSNDSGKYVKFHNVAPGNENNLAVKSVHKQDGAVNASQNNILSTEQQRKKDQREQRQIEKEMAKHRKKQLLEANVKEDRIIRQMEKNLGLNKRKSKKLPKSFSEDGLDYLLEVCDSEAMRNAIEAEKGLQDVNEQFDEDFQLMAEPNTIERTENESCSDQSSDDYFSEDGDETQSEIDVPEHGNTDSENSTYESEFVENFPNLKRKLDEQVDDKNMKIKLDNENDHRESQNNSNSSDKEVITMLEEAKGVAKINEDGTWEDIYGRLRSKDGSVLQKNDRSKYVPPALRQKVHNEDDPKRVEKLTKLKKHLKGLLNRLAESNMHTISSQIEDLYMSHSRNDINDTLTNLIMESLVTSVLTTDRLLIEHVVLVTILHANVGSEVGAHFLQRVAKDFSRVMDANHEVENKSLDNICNILAQLYNFRLFDCKLIYEIVSNLSEKFHEKNVECILHILKSVGFSLRKDDPLALKKLILDLQQRAIATRDDMGDCPRVKFMLDILLAIKNNNVKKIPNYDTSYSEHMKKVMKGFIRKGNFVTQLNISLKDLLDADHRGRWWVVGSAWTGNEADAEQESQSVKSTASYSQKLLELAKEQRMNTDTRKNIFCILMSAEDYLDAFEKILKLGLKNQQEREIINIILHCCLREKKYNPYYGFVAQKFCDYNRKFQMIIKYSIWDKLKVLKEHSGNQLSNLAKLLTHLFIENGLPISVLKIVEFSELDNVTLRFMRQILIGILLHKDEEACMNVFLKVSKVEKLKMFRESLRLFIHHFLLRNIKSETISETHKATMERRANLIEKILSSKENRL